MAQVMKEWGGRVVTMEINEEYAAQAARNFERWQVADAIDLIRGDAFQVLPQMRRSSISSFSTFCIAEESLWPTIRWTSL
jgi:predicted O-methyltransferase YrrM